MFTRAASRLFNSRCVVPIARFGSRANKNTSAFTAPRAGLLGLIAVGITGYKISTMTESAFYEKIIDANLKEGEKIEVQVGPKQEDLVIVAKVDGKYYCVSSKCPHFGAPLGKGPMFSDKLVCPFHNATFSVKDGTAEGGPMVNGLENFEVTLKDGKLHLKVEKSRLNVSKPMDMVKRDINDQRNFVIIGGGPSGISAAETLRQAGYTGKITILSKEEVLPYDRTMLSKIVFGADISKIQYRSKEFLEAFGIDVLNGSEVRDINTTSSTVTINGGEIVNYDKLLIATGGSPRRIPVEGANAENVHTLRDYADLSGIKASCSASKKLVIIGASFIGLETAASIKDTLKDKIDVTVVDTSAVPYERVLGSQVGQAVMNLHATNGIKFNLKTGVKAIETENGVAKRVVLTDGTVLEADTILIGAGVIPNTQFLPTAIEKDVFGAVKTDVFLQTSNPNVFAAGDVASYPYHYTGQRVRFEHINSSIYQGYIAALNMVGQKAPVAEIPFFWTRFWNKSLHYTGYASQFDDVIVQGDLDKQEFVAWYAKNNRIVAAAAMNKGPVTMIVSEAMKQNVMPTAAEIKNGTVTVEDIKKRVEQRGKNCKCSRGKQCCSAKKAAIEAAAN